MAETNYTASTNLYLNVKLLITYVKPDVVPMMMGVRKSKPGKMKTEV